MYKWGCSCCKTDHLHSWYISSHWGICRILYSPQWVFSLCHPVTDIKSVLQACVNRDFRKTKQIREKSKRNRGRYNIKVTQRILFQETSPNSIKWAFLDGFSSDFCVSQEKAVKLTSPLVISKLIYLMLQRWYSVGFCRSYCPRSYNTINVWF